LNDVVRATSRESGVRDKKVIKLHQLLNDSSKSTFDLVNFNTPVSLIVDPSVKITGTYVEKATIFKSNLMPCKFVFRTVDNSEYSVIYKIGDDLRQDQLVLQMIALMDKVSICLI
jgi:phosphatidylinositol 3-kinase